LKLSVADLSQQKDRIMHLEGQVQSLTQANEDLKSELQALNKQNEALKATVATPSESAPLSSPAVGGAASVEELETKLSEASKQLAEQSTKMTKLRSLLGQALEHNKALTGQLTTKQVLPYGILRITVLTGLH